jgi:MFS family permease
MTQEVPVDLSADGARRRTIGFLNWAHAVDHFVLLIYPTVVIGLQVVYGRSYAELIALSTAAFVAFGVFSLPAGWLADHWSRRNMMAVFYFGCGGSLVAAGLAPNLVVLAVALFALGMFAAIYHPVGMAMLIEVSKARGRTLAFNGVCGNMGAALAAGITAALVSILGWRAAFLAPAAFCIATGILFLRVVPDDRHETAGRKSAAEVPITRGTAMAMFALFVAIAIAAGLVFNTVSVALPKIVDERIGEHVPLAVVGGLATAVFLCGALAQLAVGRLVEWVAPHLLLPVVVALQVVGILWAASASGMALLAALAVAMAAIYAQVTVGDIVIARYTADSWRGRIYAVRYFLTFTTSGAAVAAMALFYARGGFDLVLTVTAVIAGLFLAAAVAVCVLAIAIENGRVQASQPAE